MTVDELCVLPTRVLPPDFEGPVCVECKFASHRFSCTALTPKEIRPAQRNPITGEVSDAWLKWTECRDQNANGDCELFERKSSEAIPEVIEIHASSFWRRLVARIGAALVMWAHRSLSSG